MTQALTETDRRFLDTPRIGVLISTTREGRPIGVPVWFQWDGERVQMFSAGNAPKTRRLRRNSFASLLVTNRVGEPEHWVAFDGDVAIDDSGGFELAERLAAVYWDLDDPERAAALAKWREHRDVFCRLTLKPTRVRTGS